MTTNRQDFSDPGKEQNNQYPYEDTKFAAGEPRDSAEQKQPASVPHNEDDLPQLFARMQELKEEASESKGTRGRSGRGGWLLSLLTLALLAGACFYAFPILSEHGVQLAELAGVQESYEAVSARMDVLEGNLQAWATWQDGIAKRLSEFDKKLNNGLLSTGRRAEALVAELGKKLEANLATQMRATQERVDQVLQQMQTNQESDRLRLAQLENEVAGIRQGMAQQLAQSQQSITREVAGLRDETLRNRTTLEELSATHDRERLDFEATKDQRLELAPGIHVTFKGNDVRYQRVHSGWLLLAEDGRILWIDNLHIQQPLIFYTQKEKRPYELVLTRVTGDDVIGYLLAPRKNPTLAANGRAAWPR